MYFALVDPSALLCSLPVTDNGMSEPSPGDSPRRLKGAEPNGRSTKPSKSRPLHGKEALSSFIARSGFPLLATSSYLVQEISQEVETLLECFAAAWTVAVGQAAASKAEDPPSPFVIFQNVYIERKWHLYQMHWSEHRDTRLSIYHSFIRVLTGECCRIQSYLDDPSDPIASSPADSLRPFLPLLSISKTGSNHISDALLAKVPTEEIVKATGILFALKLMQSTTLATLEKPSEEAALCIPIEADLFHVVTWLPSIVQKTKALGEWNDWKTLHPIDDVVYILKDMMGVPKDQVANGYNGDISLEEREKAAPGSGTGVFEVLIPTTYEARPALINNCLSTKGEVEKKEGKWGGLRISEAAPSGIGMSRADLMRNLVRQRLELPLRGEKVEGSSPASGHSTLSMDPFKSERRGRAKEDLPVIAPPGKQAEDALQECRDDLVQQREAYEAAKKQHLDGVDFASLLPTLQDSTMQSATSFGSIDLPAILAEARGKVVHEMRKSMTGQRHS